MLSLPFVHDVGAAEPPSAEGKVAAAATDNADATRAAMEIMAQGGSAADGAIAAALVLGVTSPTGSGIGGGGFALVYSAHDKTTTVADFRETAPRGFDPEVFAKKRESRGVLVGVPGEPAGLEWLSRKLGRKTLAEDAASAVSLARRGFYVSHHTASAIGHFGEKIGRSPALSKDLVPNGNPLGFGARATRPDLARTLERFGVEGKRALYEGAIAQRIVEATKAQGGALDAKDLADYAVRERKPLTKTFGTRTVITMPAPSAGGLMLLETLGMLGADASSPTAKLGYGSSAYLHTVAEAMRFSLADRVRVVGDPDLDPDVPTKVDALLADARLAAAKARIFPDKTTKMASLVSREQGTSHIVVVDGDGNVVSLTTTINSPFGAAIVADGTGVLLNDELDDFSLPADVGPLAPPGLLPNRPRALARPVSSMTPTIVLEDGVPVLALGGSGGQRIATEVTQAALCRLVFARDPSACVSLPRMHVAMSGELFVERDVPEDVREGLKKRGEPVKDELPVAPAVQMISVSDARDPARRTLRAAADPRKGGLASAR